MKNITKKRELTKFVNDVNTANERIFTGVRETVWPEMPTEPTVSLAWAWWHAYNGYARPLESSEKELVEVTEDEVQQFMTTTYRASASCFEAGTPVWTDRGAVPIETIQTGDRVLAVDADRGELTYAVVLYPTSRIATAKFDLELGTETVRASAGHPFWDCESGWVAAKHLTPHTKLKTRSGAVALHEIRAIIDDDQALNQPVYNLVVDQTHNYFVGRSQVLVHDNTIPQPRDAHSISEFSSAKIATK